MDPIETVIRLFGEGAITVVFDDEDRENEADLIVNVQHLTPEKVAFLAEQAKGLICAPIAEELARKKGFPLMPTNKGDLHATAFTLSIDSRKVKTGISPAERCLTAKEMIEPETYFGDFVTPGHMFPLIARPGGLLERRGHTEAAIELCRCGRVAPAALVCEMIHPQGHMYTIEEARAFAKEHNLPFCTVAELVEYRKLEASNVEAVATAQVPTEYGTFRATVYRELYTNKEHILFAYGDYRRGPVRVHSECLTGDVFHSRKCDCGGQLHASLSQISKEGCGALIYLRQEGRDIGLSDKIRAYALQDEQNLDTIDANLALGHKADERDFHQAAWILKEEGFTQVRLLTNNPQKIATLRAHGLEVTAKRIEIPSRIESLDYMLTKKYRMGHDLCLEETDHGHNH